MCGLFLKCKRVYIVPIIIVSEMEPLLLNFLRTNLNSLYLCRSLSINENHTLDLSGICMKYKFVLLTVI